MNPNEVGASFDLLFGPYTYEGPATTFTMRSYNRQIPGPTIRVAAGDTIAIRLSNILQDVNNGYPTHNDHGHLNTTNIHTHGIHVSGMGNGDNPFIAVGPGTTYDYEIELPADHMGGTFFYHPHAHGSTTMQAGGGAAGVLIVEDADGEVPPEIAAMEDKVMLMQHIDVAELVGIQERFNDALWQVEGSTDHLFLVNGLTQPTMDLAPGTWYRWRMVYSSIGTDSTLSFGATTSTAQYDL